MATTTLDSATTGLREGYARVGEVDLHYVEAGDGPLVLLLHGFPEFWYGWRQQIAPLVKAGFRVVAPDLRGYNLSSGRRASPPTRPTSWPPTSAGSSASSAPSPRWWSVTTGAERSRGPSR
jgi:pimeloyl-ACP methyl ester carboxylesterase